MRATTLLVAFLLVFVAPPLTTNATAQSAAAAVDLTCTPPYSSGAIDVDVYPGASLTGYTECTVSNPTVHTEKIEITVTSGPLASAAPGSITVAAGGESDFQVTVRADSMMYTSSYSIQITARVLEISGVPPPNNAESTVQNLVNIKQFAQLNLEVVEPDVEIFTGEEVMLDYRLYNLGNGYDMFNFNVEYDDAQDMKISMPMAKIQAESYGPPARFNVKVTAPADGSMWATDSDGRHYYEMKLKVTAESEFSCMAGNCVSMTVTQNIVFYENQTSSEDSGLISSSIGNTTLIYGGGGVGIVLLLMLLFVLKRKRN